MEGEEGKQQPHLALAHKLFLLDHPDVADLDKVRLKEEVLEAIKSDGSRTRLEICSLFDIFLWKLIGKVGSLFFPEHVVSWTGVLCAEMAPLYQLLVDASVLELDQGLLDSMRVKLEEELKRLDEK